MHTHTSAGEALVKQLRWVHDLIRHDLATVRRLAGDVLAGAAPAAVKAELAALQTAGPLWQLRVNCLRYCGFVHLHHSLESAELFPALRRADPALDAVVDKLEADHLRVSQLLDDVEAAAHSLTDDLASRRRVAETLSVLATDLLAHLEFEEEQISPTLRTWQAWP
jgi:hypothetical protein